MAPRRLLTTVSVEAVRDNKDAVQDMLNRLREMGELTAVADGVEILQHHDGSFSIYTTEEAAAAEPVRLADRRRGDRDLELVPLLMSLLDEAKAGKLKQIAVAALYVEDAGGASDYAHYVSTGLRLAMLGAVTSMQWGMLLAYEKNDG